MINSYKALTGKYLLANKKRTALTLIGIILSVALISAIGFFLKSLQQTQIEDMKNTYGSWHIMYEEVDEVLLSKISSNPSVKSYGLYSVGGEIAINEGLKGEKILGTKEGLELLPFILKEGRFPNAENEIALEGWVLERLNSSFSLGDKIKLEDKEYTIVGIIENSVKGQYQGVGWLLIFDNNGITSDSVLLVEVATGRRMLERIEELKALANKDSITQNDYIIMAQGRNMPEGMLMVLVVIIGIVIISTIAVIYNAFQISVVERVKQFGLLRAVGATPKQIRRIILRESGVLALFGIPLGLGCGIAALYGIDIAFRIIGGGQMKIITPTISIEVVLISIVIALLSIYLSALLPAIYAGRVSPIDAISSRTSIIKEDYKKGRSSVIGRLFGFSGVLAAKNIKRNRKRFRITVFSIIISVALFVSFKSFIDMSLNVYKEHNESNNIHFSLTSRGELEGRRLENSIIDGIDKLPSIETAYRIFNSYEFNAVIDKSKEQKEIKEIGGFYEDIVYEGISKTKMAASLVVYDKAAMEAAKGYLKEGNIDLTKIEAENGVIIIGKNTVKNFKTDKRFYGPIAKLRVGDEIDLQLIEFNQERVANTASELSSNTTKRVKVMAVLERNPFDFQGNESAIKIIASEAVAEGLIESNLSPYGLNIKLKDVKYESQVKAEIEALIRQVPNIALINYIDQNRTNKAGILMVKILLYGFVVVVTLIGSVNIINTITTNIILRKREFAVLKSIGLTEKGLRKMITLEGILYGVIGSLYGSVIGVLLSYLLYKGISGVREQSYSVPLEAIFIAVVGAIFIGYVSVLIPLRRMKHDNLIEAVRQDY